MVGAPDTLQAFLADQLAGVAEVEFRAMFGGYGIYAAGTFFAILHRERVYFKTDEATRGAYERRGMRPFRPSAKQTLKNYYEVPAEVIDDADALAAWAREAIACQERARRPAKPRRVRRAAGKAGAKEAPDGR